MSTESKHVHQKRKRVQYQPTDLNLQMHPRNIYRNNRPDFAALAQQFLSFKPYVKNTDTGNAYIDFKNADASRELTKCLFKKDFNLDVDFPKDTLCPPIPNRLNYILWIEDLLSESNIVTGAVHGLDIGVGASCVYPLLGCATNKAWEFVGTDIDSRSIDSAQKNVERNHLQNRIKIFHTVDKAEILPLDKLEHAGIISAGSHFSFSMCNPPFFASAEEIQAGFDTKTDDPAAACTGTENEMITDGGEAAFISRMVNESARWKDRIKWYTTMIGKKDTLLKVKQEMKAHNIDNYTVTEFNQGRTKRWGFAWSFGDQRAAHSGDGAPVAKKLRQVQAPKSQFSCQLPTDAAQAQAEMKRILDDLEAQDLIESPNCITGSMFANTWSRKARRRRAANATAGIKTDPVAGSDVLIAFKLTFENKENDVKLMGTWMQGKQREVFESFWNHVKKRIEQSFGIVHGDKYGHM